MTEYKLKKDEEYLDKEFSKGKTKFRGQAMILLVLARQEGIKEGKTQEQERILKIIDEFAKDCDVDGRRHNYKFFELDLRDLKQKIKDEK